MNKGHSNDDNYQFESEVPPSRGCFRALLGKPNYPQPSLSRQNRMSFRDDISVCQSSSGLLEDKENEPNTSFFSANTDKTDCTGASNGGKKVKNRVGRVLCRMKGPTKKSAYCRKVQAEVVEKKALNITTYSQRSDQVLLQGSGVKEDLPNFDFCSFDNTPGGRDQFDRRTIKTTSSCSSVGSSYDEPNDRRLSSAIDNSFNSETLNHFQKHRSLGKAFRGCAKFKKKRDKGNSEIPSNPPLIPEALAFNTSIVDDSDFPQILFAHDAKKEEEEWDRRYSQRVDVPTPHFDEAISPVAFNQSKEEQMYSSQSIRRKERSRSPRTIRDNRHIHTEKTEAKFHNTSRARSRVRSCSRSRAAESLLHEEQMLDKLVASVFTDTSNNNVTSGSLSSLKKEIKGITGRTPEERDAVAKSCAGVPTVIDVSLSEQSDPVSEFDMDGASIGKLLGDELDEDEAFVGSNLAFKAKEVDERSVSWRLREGKKKGIESEGREHLRDKSQKDIARVLRSTSLMDLNNSDSFYSADNKDIHEGPDTSYIFGGTGFRKPTLALSEAIGDNDFQIIDGYRGANDTFNFDDDDDEEEMNKNLTISSIIPDASNDSSYNEEINIHSNKVKNRDFSSGDSVDNMLPSKNNVRPLSPRPKSSKTYRVADQKIESRSTPIRAYIAQQKVSDNGKQKALSETSPSRGIIPHQNSGIPTTRRQNSLRSSKYREVDGTALKIERRNSIGSPSSSRVSRKPQGINSRLQSFGSSTSNNTRPWSNTSNGDEIRKNAQSLLSGSVLGSKVQLHEQKGLNEEELRDSPQGISDYDAWDRR